MTRGKLNYQPYDFNSSSRVENLENTFLTSPPNNKTKDSRHISRYFYTPKIPRDPLSLSLSIFLIIFPDSQVIESITFKQIHPVKALSLSR